MAGYQSVSAVETVDDIWFASLTGLEPDTTYYFAVAGDTDENVGRCHTSVAEGTEASFSIWAAGDAGHSGMDYPASGVSDISDAPTFDHLRDLLETGTVVGGWYLGDRHYRDSNTTTLATRRAIWHDVMLAPTQYALHWQGWMMHTWDDHDYCGNNTNGSASGKAIAQQAFRENVPWPYEEGSGPIYYTWVRGRVRFIDLDVRSERSSNGATDNSSKTRLGATQKQWFKDTLLAATEPVIVVNMGTWVGGSSSSDGWNSFSTERTELWDYFEANNLMDRLWLIGGDLHCLIDDSGANTNFATGAVTDGPPYSGFAPIDAGIITNSSDAETIITTRRQAFGVMTFEDSGTDITVTARGYSLSADGTTYSESFERMVVFSG
jgi:alkaline phosphatase D